MKRLVLLPALALALAACSEAPTAPAAIPGAPQFNRLADPNSDLAFADEGDTTSCIRMAQTEVTCTFDITGAGSRDIYVETHVEIAWSFYCEAKNPRNNTSGVHSIQRSIRSGLFSGDPLTGSLVHTVGTPPTDNPCPRKGKPALIWGTSVQSWSVYADDTGYDDRDPTMWICKGSDGQQCD